jgi:hypothetical protein
MIRKKQAEGRYATIVRFACVEVFQVDDEMDAVICSVILLMMLPEFSSQVILKNQLSMRTAF